METTGQTRSEPGGPAAVVLQAAAGAPADLTQEHHERRAESGVSPVQAVLAAMGAHAGAMPGRLRAAAGVSASLMPFLLLYWPILALSWRTSGPEIVLTCGAFTSVAGVPLGWAVRRATMQQLAGQAQTQVRVPEQFQPMLRRLRLRRLEVTVQPDPVSDRCYRLGRRGLVLLSESTEAHPSSLRFVLWHEIAHLARRDGPRFVLQHALARGLLLGALMSFDLSAIAVACGGVLPVWVASRWWAELACDRLAVRHAGRRSMQGWAAGLGRPRAGGRLKGLLTHPPLR